MLGLFHSAFPHNSHGTIMDFPLEIWVTVTNSLSKKDIFLLACTNKHMFEILTSDTVWKSRVRSCWYLSDYSPETLTAYRTSHDDESCFRYFQRRKRQDLMVDQVVNKIKNINVPIYEIEQFNTLSSSIEDDLLHIYESFKLYTPTLLNKTLHITTKLYTNKNGYITENNFKKLQQRRNIDLAKIYISSKILDIGKFYEAYKFGEKLYELSKRKNNSSIILEDVLVKLSLFDSRYHELILVRHKFLMDIKRQYQLEMLKNSNDKLMSNYEKLKFLVNLLYYTAKANRKLILRYQNSPRKITLEDLSILRFYGGDSNGTPLIRNAVVQKLVQLVELDVSISINENCVRVVDDGDVYYLFLDDFRTYKKLEHEVPGILKIFHLFEDTDAKFFNFFNYYTIFFEGFKSRVDDFKGADQIIYQLEENEKIVTVHRGSYIQGQILGCGGFINEKLWINMTVLLSNRYFHDKQSLDDLDNSFFILPLFKNILRTAQFPTPHECYIKELIYSEATSDDIYWECENLQVGDIVWSDISQARGVIVNMDEVSTNKPTSVKTIKGNEFRVSGPPYYHVFFGSGGFATFSRQFLKRDQTDRVEGLLVYDLIGRWFSTYDYDSHKFVYRHRYLFG